MWNVNILIIVRGIGETMRILTVWHRLLIFYIKRKNEIIENLTGITYVGKEDIEDIKTWSKADVKKALSIIGHTDKDGDDCPWCSVYGKLFNCSITKDDGLSYSCTYAKRHGWCREDNNGSTYRRLKYVLANRMQINNKYSGFNKIQAVKDLSLYIKSAMEILPEIL